MARRDNTNNPLQIRIEAVSIPRGTKPRVYLSKLIQAIDTGQDLPRGWDVQLHWRNPHTISGATRNWRQDDFVDAVADSRPGFNDIVRNAILKRLRRLPR